MANPRSAQDPDFFKAFQDLQQRLTTLEREFNRRTPGEVVAGGGGGGGGSSLIGVPVFVGTTPPSYPSTYVWFCDNGDDTYSLVIGP